MRFFFLFFFGLQNPVVPVGPVATGDHVGERKRGRDRSSRREGEGEGGEREEEPKMTVKQHGSSQAQVRAVISLHPVEKTITGPEPERAL